MSWLEKRWYSHKPAPCWLLPLEKLFCKLAAQKSTKDKQAAWTTPVPVIIVGNISVGGTGKTPLVEYLVNLLREQGYKPGIVSRGYKSQAEQYPFLVDASSSAASVGDEPFLLFKRCQCPIAVDPKRVSAAKFLLEHTDCDVIISDDGMQHYHLARDIEIAVVDAQRGLGNGRCLPAGPLREPPQRLSQVDFIVSNGTLDGNTHPLLKPYVEASQAMELIPTKVVNCADDSSLEVEEISGMTFHAVAGIGNPELFFKTVESLTQTPVIRHPMPDHHQYQAVDFEFNNEHSVIMTEKDAVKVTSFARNHLWYLEVSAQLPDNFAKALLTQLDKVIEGKKNG